jgi:hypothetical protein
MSREKAEKAAICRDGKTINRKPRERRKPRYTIYAICRRAAIGDCAAIAPRQRDCAARAAEPTGAARAEKARELRFAAIYKPCRDEPRYARKPRRAKRERKPERKRESGEGESVRAWRESGCLTNRERRKRRAESVEKA